MIRCSVYPICLLIFIASEINAVGPSLLVSCDNTISAFDITTNASVSASVISDSAGRPFMIDYHLTTGYVYWTDINSNSIVRTSYLQRETGQPKETIIPQKSGHRATGLAVDSLNDILYWSDDYGQAIMRSNLDGSNQTTLLHDKTFSSLRSLALDLKNRWLYFAAIIPGKIEKCDFDGRNRQTIIASDSSIKPIRITLDLDDERLYWADLLSSAIKSVAFDGSDVKTVFQSENAGLNSLAIYNNYIYYGFWSTPEIWRIEKSGENFIFMYEIKPGKIDDLKILYTEECTTYKKIENEELRSAGYILDIEEDNPFTDDTLEEDWYRVIGNNGDLMPTFPPGILHCGTVNPVWLNGSYPSPSEGNVTREACVQTRDSICEEKILIEVKSCYGFYLYFLRRTPINSSYCFGNGPVSCPDGMSSETGFYPGCTTNFPSETISVEVEADLIEGQSFQIGTYDPTPSLLPIFICKFNDTSHGKKVYDVRWFINGNSVVFKKNIEYDDLDITILRDTDWIGTYRMNMVVQCAVRIRYFPDSSPGPFQYSLDFKAGLYPEKYEYTVIEGEHITITFTPTVPVGCIASHEDLRSWCEQYIYIFQPKHDENTPACSNNIAKKDIVFKSHFCGINLKSLNWREKKTIQVHGFSDGLYNHKDRSTYIRLAASSFSDFNEMWKDFAMEDIKVNVIDKDSILTNRVCQSYNDPHITTFDGIVYHYMEIGEFVLYRNDKGPYWVHVLLTNCGFGWQGSACHCGVAVRSRNSLFVLRTCKTISRTEKYLLDEPITELDACDENDLAIVQNNNNNYKITLPIGTEISIAISPWSRFIGSISVKPSIFDINEAKGLCGVPNPTKDPSDDFYYRENGPINDDQIFGDSWRVVSAAEQLFVEEPEFLTENYVVQLDSTTENNNLTRYCTCEREAKTTDSLDKFYTVQCNLTESTEYCTQEIISTGNIVDAFHTSCTRSSRTRRSATMHHKIVRRSLTDSDDVMEFVPLTYDDSVYNKSTVIQTFRNGWTEEKAYLKCREDIKKALPSSIYEDFVDLQEEKFIESCVMDIKLTGDTSFLSDTINTMISKVMTELLRNETLYIINGTDDSQTMLELVTSSLCPNNCSNNGNCSLGTCHCKDMYAGIDCSRHLSEPPENIIVPFSGLCSIKHRACERTNIYGDFESKTVRYKLKHVQILQDSVLYTSYDGIYKAEYRNMFMVSVDLKSTSRKKSTSESTLAEGFEISLSYDGNNFGKSVFIVIFDDDCYSCNATDLSCKVKDACQKPTVLSNVSRDNSTFIAIAATTGIILALIVSVIVLLYLKSKAKGKKQRVDTLVGQISDICNKSDTNNVSRFPTKWMPTERTHSDLDHHIDDSRCGTSFELFERQCPPQNHQKMNI